MMLIKELLINIIVTGAVKGSLTLLLKLKDKFENWLDEDENKDKTDKK